MSAASVSALPAGPFPSAEPTAAETLQRHGRTFHFAGKILGKERLHACARLYRFCRTVDDIADHTDDPAEASCQLDTILRDLGTGRSDDSRVRDFLDLAREHRLDLRVAAELVKGVRSDCGEVRFSSEAELKRYCFRVAGTVGILMCGVLGIRDPRAIAHAIDLGMAMQLTNIARDVAEDARNGRAYLPDEALKPATLFQIANGSPEIRGRLKQSVQKWLAEADSYYRSGEAGLAFLPLRSRLAILVAARAYRAIGTVLSRRGFATWRGRAVVPRRQKRIIALRAVVDLLRSPHLWRKPTFHNPQLHKDLGGLPCVDHPSDSPTQSP